MSGAGTTQGPNANVSSEAPPPTSTPAAVTTKTSQPISTTPALSPAERKFVVHVSGQIKFSFLGDQRQVLVVSVIINTSHETPDVALRSAAPWSSVM